MIRMAYLSVVGSTKVNGVAALHTELLKKNLFSSFHELYPNKLINMTNGITPRRWLLACNPWPWPILIREVRRSATRWPKDLDKLQEVADHADNAAFQKKFMAVKRENKVAFAEFAKLVSDQPRCTL